MPERPGSRRARQARKSGAHRRVIRAAGLAAIGLLGAPGLVHADPGNVSATVHNLSVTGPGEVRALQETEVCKFCHIPHNAVVAAPLWGHALSQAQYRTPSVQAGQGARVPAGQPDGASRLCLSCHDGTVALGDIAGQSAPVAMTGAARLGPGRPGFLGTDLSGSHPVSFAVPDGDQGLAGGEEDMGLRPLGAIEADPDVTLDAEGKMQCTTCHDPHSDLYYQPGRVPRFWVKPTVEEVCVTCHVPR